MSETLPNWDLRRIPAAGPYVRVLARGCPALTGSCFPLLHPQMRQNFRAV